MDELQRYGLLSFACLVVLCLALTFKDRETQRVEREPRTAQARHAAVLGDELGAEPTAKKSGGSPVIPEPHADAAGARPDDVPLRATGQPVNAGGRNDPKNGAEPAKKSEQRPESGKDPDASPSQYQVGKGDTLRKIARARLGDEKRWVEIVAVNPGVKENSLKIGQTLKLPPKNKPAAAANPVADTPKPEVAKAANAKAAAPKSKPAAPRTHTVAKGETLSAIARRYYNDALAWKKIYNANKGKMKSATDVREGLVLSLP